MRLALILSLLVTLPAAADDYPYVFLKTDALKVKVYLPDAEKGFYRGTRFDWSGVFGDIGFAGHSLFHKWKDSHDPKNHDDIIGPVEEFGMEKPLNYDAAKVGETFLKIGIGELEKPKEEKYRFYHNYKVVKPGVWTTKQINPAKIEFHQKLTGPNGYAYEYTKTVTLDPKKPSLVIGHTFTNTGTKPIATDHYNHNFFNVDGKPVGSDYEFDFGFPVKADGKERFAEVVKLDGKAWRFTKPLDTGSVFAQLKELPKDHPAQPYVVMRHKSSKVSVTINGSEALARMNVWGMKTTICPEPFIDVNAKPGETVRWMWSYEFAVTAAPEPSVSSPAPR